MAFVGGAQSTTVTGRVRNASKSKFTHLNVTILKRHLTELASLEDGPLNMQIKFDTARKLINELEAKLNDTSAHTAAARKALDEWMQSGDAGLHKKGASALKQVRKRADSFTKALAKLEQNIVKSSDSTEKKSTKKPSKKAPEKSVSKPTKSKSDAKAMKSTNQAGKKKAKPNAASKKEEVDTAAS